MKIIKFIFFLLFLSSSLYACMPVPSPRQPEVPSSTIKPPTARPQIKNTPQPESGIEPIRVQQSEVELITNNADSGNAWGGHQSRIVHTQDGIFTAYITSGTDEFSKQWHLVQRQDDGTWAEMAVGNVGGQPANLLAGPDGTLYLIGWPNGLGTLWTGNPENGKLEMVSSPIPNQASGNYPYTSAGINVEGVLCILSSTGGENPVGWFNWSCYHPESGEWITQVNKLDFRYCYTYVFPGPDGQLSLISTRDVRWQVLGYEQPQDAFDYVFNAYGLWHTENTSDVSMERVYLLAEEPNDQYPFVYLDAQQDAYLDTQGRMHIIYRIQGPSTNNESVSRHAILSTNGNLIVDLPLPQEAGEFSRIFQDKKERYYLIGSAGFLYPMDRNGIELGEPVQLDFARYDVEYSGFGLSVPRTGTPLSDVLDVVFPTNGGTDWVYFQLDFSDQVGSLIQSSPVSSETSPSASELQSMIDNAKILFDLNMTDTNLTGMDWWGADRATLQHLNGSLVFIGALNAPQLHSQYGLKVNEACIALVRFTEPQDFQYKAIAGNWDDADSATWGLASGIVSYYHEAQNNFVTQPMAGYVLDEDRWYFAMLWVNGPTTFTVRLWEKENPEVFTDRTFIMNDNMYWTDRRWNCVLLVNNGTVEMSSYREIRFIPTP